MYLGDVLVNGEWCMLVKVYSFGDRDDVLGENERSVKTDYR